MVDSVDTLRVRFVCDLLCRTHVAASAVLWQASDSDCRFTVRGNRWARLRSWFRVEGKIT